MKKQISLALALVMILCLSTTAFATTVNQPGDVTAEVTGSYVPGNESNGIVYSVGIKWDNLDFTYHAEKGAVWNTETLKYSETEEAYWEGEGTITVTNRSNTKITAVPEYTPEEGYADAGMDFDPEKLRVASADKNGTEQTGTITVTPNGFLPAMDGEKTIGIITLTIAQDTDIDLEQANILADKALDLYYQAQDNGAYDSYTAEFVALDKTRSDLVTTITAMEALLSQGDELTAATYQSKLNENYESTLWYYEECKGLAGL